MSQNYQWSNSHPLFKHIYRRFIDDVLNLLEIKEDLSTSYCGKSHCFLKYISWDTLCLGLKEGLCVGWFRNKFQVESKAPRRNSNGVLPLFVAISGECISLYSRNLPDVGYKISRETPEAISIIEGLPRTDTIHLAVFHLLEERAKTFCCSVFFRIILP